MIQHIIQFLTDQLNQHFHAEGDSAKLYPTPLSVTQPRNFPKDGLAITLLNIEQKQALGGRPETDTPIEETVLQLLISANLGTSGRYEPDLYLSGLKQLSAVMAFFDSRNLFSPGDHRQLQEVTPGLKKLSVSFVSADLKQLHRIWSMLGVSHRPAALFQARILHNNQLDLADFEASLEPGGRSSFTLSGDYAGFRFVNFERSENSPIHYENGGSTVSVTLLSELAQPYVFSYQASDGQKSGRGTISIHPSMPLVSVRGVVRSDPTGETLAGVSVRHLPSGRQVATDGQGRFEISQLNQAEGTLTFSQVGFVQREVVLSGNTFLEVSLSPFAGAEPTLPPGIEIISQQSMRQILMNRRVVPGFREQLIENFIASVSQQPLTAAEIRNVSDFHADTLHAFSEHFGIDPSDLDSVVELINQIVQRAVADGPERPTNPGRR